MTLPGCGQSPPNDLIDLSKLRLPCCAAGAETLTLINSFGWYGHEEPQMVFVLDLDPRNSQRHDKNWNWIALVSRKSAGSWPLLLHPRKSVVSHHFLGGIEAKDPAEAAQACC